ncbi:MAG: hypothetical protein GY804_00960 [Alphaproteobacteria bacterium]|nr:hypothetical protein [Alphaproteobacteria bacterium]
MKDRDFLIWLHERLVQVHREKSTMDYMHKLRVIIKSIDPDKDTPNMRSGNDINDLMKDLGITEIEGI